MFCPNHGKEMVYLETVPDVATSHDKYLCEEQECGVWECTFDGTGELLYIAPAPDDWLPPSVRVRRAKF